MSDSAIAETEKNRDLAIGRVVAPNYFLTVAEVASRLRVKSSWVYEHAQDLGVYRLGKYLRFSWDKVIERLEQQ